MSFDIVEMAKLLDPVWESQIQETDEFSDSFWSRLSDAPEGDSNTVGRKVKVRTSYNESESWAPFSSAQGYAQGGESGFTTFLIPYRTVSVQGLIDQEAIDNDSGAAHYHPVVDEMAATMMNGYKKLNRHCLMGDGLATIGVTTTSYSGGGNILKCIALPTSGTFGYKGSQFVKPGQKVQIYDATGATLRNGTIGGEGILTVDTNVKSTGLITMTTNMPSDMIATDIIVPERSAGRGVNGVNYWVASTGSLFTLSRSTYPGLVSTLTSGASGSLIVAVESMFSQMAHYIEEDMALGLNGEGGHEFFWSPTQREAYRKQAIGLGITMLGAGKIDTGYAHKEEINGYKFTVTKDHDNQRINCLRMKDWYRVTRGSGNKPFSVQPIHGNKFYNLSDSQSRISGGLGFVLSGYVNIACKNVRNQAAITALPVAGLQTGNTP
jgi:hypothetical protein